MPYWYITQNTPKTADQLKNIYFGDVAALSDPSWLEMFERRVFFLGENYFLLRVYVRGEGKIERNIFLYIKVAWMIFGKKNNLIM